MPLRVLQVRAQKDNEDVILILLKFGLFLSSVYVYLAAINFRILLKELISVLTPMCPNYILYY
jgi:hypothetical protein